MKTVWFYCKWLQNDAAIFFWATLWAYTVASDLHVKVDSLSAWWFTENINSRWQHHPLIQQNQSRLLSTLRKLQRVQSLSYWCQAVYTLYTACVWSWQIAKCCNAIYTSSIEQWSDCRLLYGVRKWIELFYLRIVSGRDIHCDWLQCWRYIRLGMWVDLHLKESDQFPLNYSLLGTGV